MNCSNQCSSCVLHAHCAAQTSKARQLDFSLSKDAMTVACAGLDSDSALHLMGLLSKLAAKGRTVRWPLHCLERLLLVA